MKDNETTKRDERIVFKYQRKINIGKLSLFLRPFGGLAQLARAFAWHAKGHRFDSGNLH